ncbi:MAG: ribosome assembly RNA-binding protein YhbY [Oscillospiraceae bacterium]|nr:ribosome assembly RNA-binding protein YhbY [Oscillospiraceae bacterium]
MLTSKQRAQLKSIANGIDTISQVGKGGIGEQVVKQADDALTAREIIKVRVLNNAPGMVREMAEELAEKTGSEVVQTIGTKFVLYRANKKDPKIKLVKE